MRSPSSSRSGGATCRRTTPTGRCPTSTPTSRDSRRSCRAGSVTTAIRSRPQRSGGRSPTRRGLSIREVAIELGTRPAFVGTPQQVADEIDDRVQSDAADGYILVPHLTPHGLDEFVDRVVPLLQERGSFRTDYAGTTLRDHLGLADRPTRVGRRRRRTGATRDERRTRSTTWSGRRSRRTTPTSPSGSAAPPRYPRDVNVFHARRAVRPDRVERPRRARRPGRVVVLFRDVGATSTGRVGGARCAGRAPDGARRARRRRSGRSARGDPPARRLARRRDDRARDRDEARSVRGTNAHARAGSRACSTATA